MQIPTIILGLHTCTCTCIYFSTGLSLVDGQLCLALDRRFSCVMWHSNLISLSPHQGVFVVLKQQGNDTPSDSALHQYDILYLMSMWALFILHSDVGFSFDFVSQVLLNVLWCYVTLWFSFSLHQGVLVVLYNWETIPHSLFLLRVRCACYLCKW